MGMFDSVSNAANAAGAPLGTLSNMLGGNMGDGAANDTMKGKPEWWRGYDLDVSKSDEETAAHAPNLVNAVGSAPVIEFIHFGWIHTSHSDFFNHGTLSGTNKDAAGNTKLKDSDRPRGVQFRSALEREALLLWLFMQSTQKVLKQKEDDSKMGGLGSALDMASSMFGGNKPSGGQTQSSELTNYMTKVVTAITPVLKEQFAYKDIHKAGVDLNQARYDYRALLDKIIAEKPEAGKGGIAGDLMNQAASLPSTITGGKGGSTAGDGPAGTLGSIVSLTQGILFKAQDIMAKLYACTARQQEGQIEDASNEMTYQAIHQTMDPFFQVWFEPAPPPPPPPAQWGGPSDPLDQLQGNIFDAAKKPIQGHDNQTRSDIQKDGNKLKGFFEKAPDNPPPGTEALEMAFNDPPKHKGEKSIVPMTMGAVATQAFTKVLDLGQLGFADTAVSAIMGLVLEFTKAVYQSLLVRDSSGGITEEDMTKSAAEDLKLVNRIKDIAVEKCAFLQHAKDWDVKQYTDHVPLANNFSLKPAGLMDTGADKIDELVEEKIQPYLQPIIAFAMKELATDLNDVRAVGVKGKCHTMEWYLGRLPMVQAKLFSNLFFPFWTALMKAGAELVGGPVGSALKSILAVADKMKKVVDDVRDDAAKVKGYADAANKALEGPQQVGTGGMNKQTKDTIKAFQDAGKATGDPSKKSPQPDTPGQQDLASHPLKSRVDNATPQKIAKADYEQMRDANPKVFKWDDPDTKDPDGSRDGANRAAGGGSSAGGGSGQV